MKKGISDFVLISTDKAVRPTNVMGASKRLAECVYKRYLLRTLNLAEQGYLWCDLEMC